MGAVAGNHSEILSNEPECWLEAVEPGRLQDPSDLPGLAAHPCPPRQRPRQRCSHTQCPSASLLSRKSGSRSSSQQGFAPGLTELSAWFPTPLCRERVALCSALPLCPQAWAKSCSSLGEAATAGDLFSPVFCPPFSQPRGLSLLPLWSQSPAPPQES